MYITVEINRLVFCVYTERTTFTPGDIEGVYEYLGKNPIPRDVRMDPCLSDPKNDGILATLHGADSSFNWFPTTRNGAPAWMTSWCGCTVRVHQLEKGFGFEAEFDGEHITRVDDAAKNARVYPTKLAAQLDAMTLVWQQLYRDQYR